MRKKDLLLALASVLVSLCIPTFAQQPYVMPEVLGRYVIEIGDLQEGTQARPKGKEDYIKDANILPEGITFKELLFSLPGITKDKSGRLVTIEGDKIVRSVFFNEQPVFPDDSSDSYYTNDQKLETAPFGDSPCRKYTEDSKLSSGTVFVRIKEKTEGKPGAEIIIEYYQNVSYDMVGGSSDYVDLGLSVKWATLNVGAAGPEEIGGFYYWGETETRQGIESSLTYKFSDGQGGYTKYNGNDRKRILDPEDDVAHVKWGGSWRMPTTKEIDELVKKCTWSWASVKGEIGFLITSNKRGYTDRSIFLPYYYGGTSGDVAYWSGSFDASPDGGCASLWICFDGNIHPGYCYRNWQLPIRPVCKSLSDSTVPLRDIPAELIEKVKAYDRNYYYKLEKGEYVIEIEPISDETGARPEYKEYPDGVKTSIIPVGTTVKELLSLLPDVETDKDGKLVTKNGNEVVTSVTFEEQMLYPENNHPIYTDDYKLEKGVLHIQIIDSDYFKERSWSPLPGDPAEGTARIRINYHPGKGASSIIRHSPDDMRQSGQNSLIVM